MDFGARLVGDDHVEIDPGARFAAARLDADVDASAARFLHGEHDVVELLARFALRASLRFLDRFHLDLGAAARGDHHVAGDVVEQEAAGLADGEGFDDAFAFDFDPLALLAFALGADAILLFADLRSSTARAGRSRCSRAASSLFALCCAAFCLLSAFLSPLSLLSSRLLRDGREAAVARSVATRSPSTS